MRKTPHLFLFLSLALFTILALAQEYFFVSESAFLQQPIAISPPSLRRTSFVIMLADDLGYGDVGYNLVNPFYSTPNINKMALSKHAFRMDRFHSPASVCSPSRASIITARHFVRDCVWGANVKYLHANTPFRAEFPFAGRRNETIARLARGKGYRTFLGGKWHLSPLEELHEFGFDFYDASAGNAPTFDSSCFCEADAGTRCEATKGHYSSAENLVLQHSYDCWIRRSPNLTPVFSRNETSASRVAAAFDRFLHSEVNEADSFFALLAFHEPHIPFIAPPWVRDRFFANPSFLAFAQENASIAADYFGAVEALDEAVGAVRASLQKYRRAEDTLVIFTSDNGPETLKEDHSRSGFGSTAGLAGRKRSLEEGGHRVPGILEWPERVRHNTVSKHPLSMLDVSATVMKLMLSETEFKALKLDGVPIENFSSHWNRGAPLFLCADSFFWAGTPKLCPRMALLEDNVKLIAEVSPQGVVSREGARLYDVEVSEEETIDDEDRFDAVFRKASEAALDVLKEGRDKCSYLFGKKKGRSSNLVT